VAELVVELGGKGARSGPRGSRQRSSWWKADGVMLYPPFPSHDVYLLPCDIPLDFPFPFHGAYRGLNVPGA